MSIQLECASCGKKLKVNLTLSGKSIKCPGCHAPCQIPAVAVHAQVSQVSAAIKAYRIAISCPSCQGTMTTRKKLDWITLALLFFLPPVGFIFYLANGFRFTKDVRMCSKCGLKAEEANASEEPDKTGATGQ